MTSLTEVRNIKVGLLLIVSVLHVPLLEGLLLEHERLDYLLLMPHQVESLLILLRIAFHTAR